MQDCCKTRAKCRNDRACPERIERIRRAKDSLDGDQVNFPLLLIGRLALAAAILLCILVGSMYHGAMRAVA